jgi:hypothetical protein
MNYLINVNHIKYIELYKTEVCEELAWCNAYIETRWWKRLFGSYDERKAGYYFKRIFPNEPPTCNEEKIGWNIYQNIWTIEEINNNPKNGLKVYKKDDILYKYPHLKIHYDTDEIEYIWFDSDVYLHNFVVQNKEVLKDFIDVEDTFK